VLSANTVFSDRFSLLLRVNYYGKHWDERGSIAGQDELDDMDVPTGFCCINKSWEIGATVCLDLDLAYQINDNWRVNVGAINILDELVDIIPSNDASGCISCIGEEWGEPTKRRLAVSASKCRKPRRFSGICVGLTPSSNR